MKKKICIILVIVIIIAGITATVRLRQANVRNDNKEEKTELDIKKETLLKKADEMIKSQAIEAFIKTGTSDEEIEELIGKISEIEGVNSVTLKNKDEVLDEMRNRFGENGRLLDTYTGENNIFPDSLIISVSDTNKIEKIEEKISKFENIDSVNSSKKTVDAIYKQIDTLNEEDIDMLLESIDKKME